MGKRTAIEAPLRLRFVVDAIEAYDPLQEDVQLRVGPRVLCDFEKRLEDICVTRALA